MMEARQDTGFDAYAYLASAWMLELLVWYAMNVGVLFLPDDPEFNLLPIVGTLSSGIIRMASLVLLPVILKYPSQKRRITFLGLILCVGGLFGAGFATRPAHLVATQGVIYSIGGSTFDVPEQFSEVN
ncbi:hypothetical protein FRC01_007423 [Tulasnella sp. 417]|nr:hypothetical protein FRC01_007423 [Tulasnella sp. 417]